MVEFPNPAALAAIAARPAARPPVEEADVAADGWTVEVGDPNAAVEAWQPRDPWDRAFGAAKGDRRARLTRPMSCVAREIGRYFLAHQAAPPHELQQFINAACGAAVVQIGFQTLSGRFPPGATDEAMLASAQPEIERLLSRLPTDASEVGFAFGRRGEQMLLSMAFASSDAELSPFSLVPDGNGEVAIEGVLHDEAQSFAGYVNHGRFAVSSCFVDPALERPRFRIVCKVDPEDQRAWIELVYAPPKRVLARPFAQILARRNEQVALTYALQVYAEPHGEPQVAPNAEQFAQAVVTELNRVRALGGLSAVRLNLDETASATQVATHYFAAALGRGQPTDMDTIALALLAGWHVTGMIRDGGFVSSLLPHTRDPGRWLASTLEMPLGRSALMMEGIEEIALGPVVLDHPDALGAVVVGYRFHHGNDHADDVKRLLIRTVQARRRMKLPPPTRLGDMQAVMQAELARVNHGTAQPMEALQRVLARGVNQFGADMRGYVVEATSLDALEIPAEVLAQPKLVLEIGVTHHKPQGAAWAQFVILVIFVDQHTTRA
ncbi:MAG: hypothetical protein E6J90_33045 [Deltaproteobacteria bacterium]|nr:MAG: hypothetical protein E6J90_33045 [Deltaproteobacteria bacterium]